MASAGARLPVIAETAATGETADLYAEICDFFGLGFVPDVLQLTSTRPSFQHTFWHGDESMFTEGLLMSSARW